MQTVFIGRQPIYDRQLNVFAYELLFRSDMENQATIVDDDLATCRVLIDSLMEIGLDNLVGARPAFINVTRKFLLGECPIPFDKERLVLEVLERVQIDDEVAAALRRLSGEGYTIAFDDLTFGDYRNTLVELANVVKIDVREFDAEQLRAQVQQMRRSPVELLAEKVETLDEYEYCRQLGFDYFQGYFLSRPRVIQGQRIPGNRLALLDLLAKLQNDHIELNELERSLCQDVGLTYKLLRYINSSAVGVRRKVDSVRQALALLGLKRLRTMVTLIALAGVDDKPLALMTTALFRARMCELLGAAVKRDDTSSFFTVGLFSSLDALLDSPMEVILRDVPLSDDLKDALLEFEGTMGQALRCTLAWERSDFATAGFLKVPAETVRECYLSAVRWVEGEEGLAGMIRECRQPQPDIASPQPGAAKRIAARAPRC